MRRLLEPRAAALAADTAPGDALTTVDEHDRVLRAVLRRNPDRAAEAMEQHLSGSWERHIGVMDGNPARK